MRHLLIIALNFLFISSYTQVGIGTQNPLAELDVQSVITETYLIDVNFSDDTDGITTSGSPVWSVQTYQDSICFSSNNTTATQSTEVTITAVVPAAKDAILTFDLYIDLTIHGTLDVNGDIFTNNENTDWTSINIPLQVGVNKVILILSGDNSSNFPGKAAIDNVKVFYPEGYALRIDDQNQQEDFVLTSDAYGNATWKKNRLNRLIDNDEDSYFEVLDDNSIKGTIKNIETFFLDNNYFTVDVSRFTIGSMRDSLGNIKWGLNNTSTGNYGTVWGGYNIGTGDGATVWGNSNEVNGLNGTAWGKSNKVQGAYGTAWGRASKASGDYSTSIGYSLLTTDTTEASGSGAMAWGINNKAEGIAATSFGWNNMSQGPFSVSWGKDSKASGAYSTAFGEGTEADTLNAVAFGKNTVASGANSLAMGIQTYALGDNAVTWGGINTTPTDSLIASGDNSTAWGSNTRASGNNSTSWGAGNISSGSSSTSFGAGNEASAINSTAWGESNVSADILSTSWGFNNQANGEKSTSWGESNQANGINSTAWGNDNFVPGEEATAWGKAARSEGLRSTAWGYETRANAYVSTSLGRYNEFQTNANKTTWIEGDPLFVVGNGTLFNRNDAIHLTKAGNFGLNTTPEEFFHVKKADAFTFKIESDNIPELTVVGSQPILTLVRNNDSGIFKIVHGASGSDFWSSSAISSTILNNGDVSLYKSVSIGNDALETYALRLTNNTAGGNAIAYSWNTYSDLRIKRNIQPLESGLEKILNLNPKRYDHHVSNFDNGELIIEDGHSNTIGLIAQETYNILPEVVVKPEDPSSDLWSIDYTKLIPVLINAIKELHADKEEQTFRIDTLQAENEKLKEQLRKYQSLESRIAALERIN